MANSTALNDFIFQSKYARYNSILGRKEIFSESVDRIMNMHITYLNKKHPDVLNHSDFANDFMEAFEAYKQEKVYGSQRALQFGGDPILRKHCRQYNCAFTYADRLEVFKEIEWVLLCGCGAGVSVERKHVNKLPKMLDKLSDETRVFKVEDSIEGWALAIHQIIQYYFVKDTPYPKFDYSGVRKNGSLISGGFVAPGPEGLKKAIDRIQTLLDKVHSTTKKLTPLNVTDIIAFCADSVLSGGVRRSALIILFDPEDEEMFNSKTGDWFYTNPQRARYNASAALDRDKVPIELFYKIFNATKQFGEPGFFWRSDEGLGCNPCAEIGFKPVINGKTGWQFCNLVTISGRNIDSEEDFYSACKHASTIATIQAAYNEFPFLGEVTEELVKSDPLIGVSISGIMCNPEILLDPKVLRNGAKVVLDQNTKIAKALNINIATRTTTVKPDGNFSSMTGNTPGCHGAHAKRYIRRVQVNKEEEAGKIYKKVNPKSVVESIWSNNHTDDCIMFAIEEDDDVVLKSELLGLKQLEVVHTLYNNWVVPGNRIENNPIQNNVSNTVIVPDNQWDVVAKYIYDNRYTLAGVSFIPQSGDLDFNQPPYTEVLLPSELIDKYGEGIIFASGLIVDAEKIFGNLWKACDTFNGIGEKLYATTADAKEFIKEINVSENPDLLDKPHYEWIHASNQEYNNWSRLLQELNYSDEFIEELMDNEVEIPIAEVKRYLDKTAFNHVNNLNNKRDIMRRMKKYADKYFLSDYKTMINALKSVQLYHDWCDITKNYKPVDWTKVKWKNVLLNADEMAGGACSGGQCEITKL